MLQRLLAVLHRGIDLEDLRQRCKVFIAHGLDRIFRRRELLGRAWSQEVARQTLQLLADDPKLVELDADRGKRVLIRPSPSHRAQIRRQAFVW
jgi:hypothetical protein